MIQDKRWDGKTVYLRYAYVTGPKVEKGETVTDGKGNLYTVTGGRAPQKESSTGRVYAADKSGFNEFFPAVFNMKWTDY